MNKIGAGIQKIKDCEFCQGICNNNLEEWEVKAKEAQEKAKEAKYCEHFGVLTRSFYDKNKGLLYELKAEGNNSNFYCTNNCCITADNGTRPDLVIYKVNAYGDEWKDPNHSFQKANWGGGIENIKCKNCSQKPEERDKPNPNKPNEPKLDKPRTINLGSDFTSLQLSQQVGRKTTDTKWKELIKKEKSQKCFACPYCQQYINWNKSQEDYVDARQLALQILETHKQSCSLKDNPAEVKNKQQEQWDQIRDKKLANNYSCQKCWGKIKWDITIADAETAKKQALADWNKHSKEECGTNNKTIAIYFSPNQGGNEHAPLTYLPSEEVPIEYDGSLIEEQATANNNQEQPTNYLPWVIGGGIVLVLIGVIVYFINKKKRK
jgi:hypothetical protein